MCIHNVNGENSWKNSIWKTENTENYITVGLVVMMWVRLSCLG
jgi:hypothetical protein